MRPGDAEEQKVYDLFRQTPENGASSYLHNHYKRGLAGLIKPPAIAGMASAAWHAGNDTRKEKADTK